MNTDKHRYEKILGARLCEPQLIRICFNSELLRVTDQRSFIRVHLCSSVVKKL